MTCCSVLKLSLHLIEHFFFIEIQNLNKIDVPLHFSLYSKYLVWLTNDWH